MKAMPKSLRTNAQQLIQKMRADLSQSHSPARFVIHLAQVWLARRWAYAAVY